MSLLERLDGIIEIGAAGGERDNALVQKAQARRRIMSEDTLWRHPATIGGYFSFIVGLIVWNIQVNLLGKTYSLTALCLIIACAVAAIVDLLTVPRQTGRPA